MTAKEKCITKWEKKLERAKEMNAKWGQYTPEHRTEIRLCEEILKDLKRLL